MSITIYFSLAADAPAGAAPSANAPTGAVHNTSALQSFSTKPGQSLMQAATRAGLGAIAADCGGSLTCATCHVYVAADWLSKLPPPSPDELSMLEMTAAPRHATSRLSCQLVATDAMNGMVISLPATQY
jgi:ferredoxin, 2Fe-2S